MKRALYRLMVFQVMMLLLVCNSYAGNVGTGDILDGAITTPKLADGAVTEAKISGLIPAYKISTSGLNADTIDGLDASELSRTGHSHSYSNVIVVAKSGGQFTSINEAIESASPSIDDRVLIKIMPGKYIEEIVLKSFVTLEGAGKDLTIIESFAPQQSYAKVVQMDMVDSVTISGLTIIGNYNLISIRNSSNINIENNNLIGKENKYVSGVNAFWTSNVEIKNNKADGASISFTSFTTGRIQNNYIKNAGAGITLNNQDENTIVKGNIIYNCERGISVNSDRSKIINNDISFCTGDGIELQGAISSGQTQILYNRFHYNGGSTGYDINLRTPQTPIISFNVYRTLGGYDTGTGSFNITPTGEVAPEP